MTIAERYGNRTSGSDGYSRAMDYAEATLKQAGFETTRQKLTSNGSFETSNLILEIGGVTYSARSMAGGTSLENTTAKLGFPASPQGCGADDFAGLGTTIVFVEEGGCPLATKLDRMQKAGIVGLIVGEPPTVTVEEIFTTRVPVLMVSVEPVDAEAISALRSAPPQVTMGGVIRYDTGEVVNLIADWPGNGDGPVVLLGAHLDAITPGANDNASGVGTALATAERLAASKQAAGLRIGLWDAEEANSGGSSSYVMSLSKEQLDQLSSYVNLDMVASPNGYLGVFGAAAPVKTFMATAETLGIPVDKVSIQGSTDTEPFGSVDVPKLGVHTGSSEKLTEEQAKKFGGTAGQPVDPCYHSVCDTFESVDTPATRARVGQVATLTEATLKELLRLR